MGDEQIGDCPIMILGNKIDKQGAASEDEIRHYFGLNGRTTGKVCRNFMDCLESKSACSELLGAYVCVIYHWEHMSVCY